MRLRRFASAFSPCLQVKRLFRVSFALLLLVGICGGSLRAQGSSATINGLVTDPNGRVVPGADVQAVNIGTNVVYPTKTNDTGIYSIPNLPPGPYRIVVRKDGFKEVNLMDLDLHTQDVLEQNFALEIGSVSESVTVNGSTTNDNPAVSMTVDREFVENMPLNGQSFQDLIQLAPGVVSSQSGYYSINGQRTVGNNYTVDGVSANLGGVLNPNASGNAVGALNGDTPVQTALGTTQSLASIDSLQEFTIQTSGYTAEYGRSPGGQVQFTTRSGTNDIHATLFEFIRNTAFDANSFQDNYYDVPQTAEHQNDFGGTVGGPLIIPKVYNGKGKTFYFFSYEGLRLLLPDSEEEFNPTSAFINAVSPNIQPFLEAVPPPNTTNAGDSCTVSGTTINPTGPASPTGPNTPCDEEFYYGYSYPDNLDNFSLRVDQNLGKRLHAFVRYADTPSSESPGAEQVSISAINVHTWTAGLTASLTNDLLNDLRFNSTRDGEEAYFQQKSIEGSVPLPRSLVIPAQYDSAYSGGGIVIYIPGMSLSVEPAYSGGGSEQHQYQIVDSLTWTKAKHSFKFGWDWRRLTPVYTATPYQSSIESLTLADIQQGIATSVQVTAAAPGQPVFHNLSLYAQDHWKLNSRLSVDYGLRWEFNPPPGPSNGHYPVTLTSSDLVTATLAPVGTQPYKTNYHSIAPRFGFAWNAVPSQSHPLTVRGGFGIFFDTGQGVIGNSYAGAYPFGASGPVLANVPFPLSDAALAPPPLNFPLTPPYPELSISDPDLTLPYTEQWNLSIDEMLNPKNRLTASYVGNNGRKLLFTQFYRSVPGNSDFSELSFTNNGSQSSYNGLQVQDTGRIVSGLDLVASFTWAHALDNASSDVSSVAPIYGNSNYDLRRVLNLALNYQTPSVGSSSWVHDLTHGWLIGNRFSTQSGYPITNLTQATVYQPNGSESRYSPNLVPGVPIYLHGSAADVGGKPVPGNWRLNSAAFQCVPTSTGKECSGTPLNNGDLGRNYVRNPSFWALNTALQRTFPIYEQLHLDFRAEAFNILNHPNLDNPSVGSLTSSTFGELIFGDVTTIGSPNALYAMGAARSLQLSLKLVF
jgi:hypothetical protein